MLVLTMPNLQILLK